MSLKIASAFISALRSNDELLTILGGQGDKKEGARIFTVARPQEDEGKDKIPYLIVQPQGLTSGGDKDAYEDGDTDTVSILIVAATYPALVELSQMVRDTLAAMLTEEHEEFIIDDYTFSVGATQMDIEKPCFFLDFNYQINTQNIEQS